MSLSVGLAVGSMVLGALADFLYKRAQLRGVRTASYLVAQACCFTLTSLVLTLTTDRLAIDATAIRYAGPTAVVLFAAFYLFLNSLREGDATVNVPIYRLSFVVTAILAVLVLGERLSGLRVLAIGLAVLGVLALADLGKLLDGRGAARSLGALLTATALFGLGAALYKAGMTAGVTPGTFLVVQAVIFLACAITLWLLTDRRPPTPATLRHAPFTGPLLATSLFLLLASLHGGDATVSVPISQLSFVLTSLLAVAFLGERLSRGRLVGTTAAVLAVVTFNLPAGTG